MAVQSDTSSISYTGNNSTSTSYAVPFYFLENSHLSAIAKVTATGVESAVTLTNHTGAGDPNGGTVRTAVAVPATSTLTIFRTVPATQTTTYQEGGDFPAASHERALDKLTFLSQQNERIAERSIRVTEADGARNEIAAIPNTIVGLDANRQPKAMTLSEVKTYLALSGVTLDVNAGMKTFANAGERALAVPEFTGQLGTQRDTADIYISTGTAAGNWADFSLALNNVPNSLITSAKLAYDGGPMSGFRNRIINGNFDIWQRGTSFTNDGFFADRWRFIETGAPMQITRQSFTEGQSEVPNNPQYFCSCAVLNNPIITDNVIIQEIEGVRTFAGETVTASFYAKANAPQFIGIRFRQDFNTDGSSDVTRIGEIQIPITTSWQKITRTLAIPSIAGKNIGTGNNDSFWFEIVLSAAGTFDIAQVQVEAGSVATPFEVRPIGTELALCQRYYYRATAGATGRFGSGHNTSTTVAHANIPFPTTMRVAPTSLDQSGTAGDYRVLHTNTSATATAVPTFVDASTNMATISITTTGLTAGQGSSLGSNSNNAFVAFSAEV